MAWGVRRLAGQTGCRWHSNPDRPRRYRNAPETLSGASGTCASQGSCTFNFGMPFSRRPLTLPGGCGALAHDKSMDLHVNIFYFGQRRATDQTI